MLETARSLNAIDDRVSQITKDKVSVVERDGKLKTLLANFMGKVEELWMKSVKRKPYLGRHFLWGPTDFLELRKIFCLM